jgi:hypothetical protein
LADPKVKAMSRNIACSAQDRLGLEPDFDLKGQFVATNCPTFFQFTWPNGFTNSHQPVPLRKTQLLCVPFGARFDVRDRQSEESAFDAPTAKQPLVSPVAQSPNDGFCDLELGIPVFVRRHVHETMYLPPDFPLAESSPRNGKLRIICVPEPINQSKNKRQDA